MASPPEVKYYRCAVSKAEMQVDDLAKIISNCSFMNKADCYGVILELIEVIGQVLADGNIVKIACLGTF